MIIFDKFKNVVKVGARVRAINHHGEAVAGQVVDIDENELEVVDNKGLSHFINANRFRIADVNMLAQENING